jgi:hypothetical protein
MRLRKERESTVHELQLIRKYLVHEERAEYPPQLTIAKGGTITMRYNANAASNVSLTGKYLLNWMSVAATATTSYRTCAAIKILKIEMWSPGNISTTTNVSIGQPGISFEWYNVANQTTDSTKKSDQPMPGRAAHLNVRPPWGTDVANWISSGGRLDSTDAMASIFVQVGTIVDYTFKYRLVDDDTVFGAEAPAGATVGKVYYDYLDGRASGVLPPLNVNVITMKKTILEDEDNVTSVDLVCEACRRLPAIRPKGCVGVACDKCGREVYSRNGHILDDA